MDPTPSWWRGLETIPGACALSARWQRALGEDFPRFRDGFLRPDPGAPAGSVPCPRDCGCRHRVVRHGPAELVGICQCDSWSCDDLPLTLAAITPWRLDLPRLGRALGRALDLDLRLAEAGLPNTLQIGAWSAAAVPVLLALPGEAEALLRLVHALAGRLRQPFILLTPTGRDLSLATREALANAGAGWFPLEGNVVPGPAGTLLARVAPGELFARFTPQPGQGPDEGAARQLLTLVAQLEQGDRRLPSVLTVFRWYCVEALSVQQVARKCGCSKPTVLDRLKLIRLKTGLTPLALRRFSGQFERMEAGLADSRARHIHRRSLLANGAEPEE